MTVKRVVYPAYNPTGVGSAAAACVTAGIAIYNAVAGHEVADAQVIIAGCAAFGFLLTRFVVTPVADPRDATGRPLAPMPLPLPPVVFTGGTTATYGGGSVSASGPPISGTTVEPQ